MWQTQSGVPLTGRLGEMLAKPLSDVSGGGVVRGVYASHLDTAGLSREVCQWCANDSELVIALDLTKQTVFARFTRTLTIAVSLFVCTSCYSVLMQSLKDAKSKQSAR